MSQPYTSARLKTPLNDFYYPHPTTKGPVEGAKWPGQMVWELTSNGRVLFKADDKVYNPNDQNAYKKKECEMTYLDRNYIFDLLLDAANNPDFTRAQYTIKRRGFVRTGGVSKLSDAPVAQGQFTIIRDQDGVISLGYTRGDYKILFVFTTPGANECRWHINGEWVEKAGLSSQTWVRSYVKSVRNMLDQKEMEIYQPPKPKNNNGGGNNNKGDNYSNNNGGGNNNNFDDEDFDIDF